MCKNPFKDINATIRDKRLYAKQNLMREDIMKLFHIGRHRLNDLLADNADGMSFPQYINAIRMEEVDKLIINNPQMTLTAIANNVGFTAPNLREQFKRRYGMSPSEYRAKLLKAKDEDNSVTQD